MGNKLVLRMVLVLTLVGAVSGGVLAYFENLTRPIIEERRLAGVAESLKAVAPGAERFEEVTGLNEVEGVLTNEPIYKALDSSGKTVAVIFNAEGGGFQGKIKLMIGVNPETKEITGVQVLNHSETPGLGSRIEEESFRSQFVGKSAESNFIPGEDIDGLAGATFSTRGFAAIMRTAPRALLAELGVEVAAAEPVEEPEPPAAGGHEEQVLVEFDPGDPAKVKDVMDRIVTGAEKYTALENAPDGIRAWKAEDASGGLVAVAFTFEAQGFGGPISIASAVDPEAKTLLGIEILSLSETPGLGARAAEEEFRSQFAGKPVADAFEVGGDIDGITGASVTSNAVAGAVKEAAEAVLSAVGVDVPRSEPAAESQPPAEGSEDAGPGDVMSNLLSGVAKYTALEGTPEGIKAWKAEDASGEVIALAFTFEAKGFGGPIEMAAAVDPDSKTLNGIEILSLKETPGLGARATEDEFRSQFAGKSLSDAFEVGQDIDGITGATITSKAVSGSVKEAAEAVLAAYGS